jgi:hypothetical protein
VDRAEPERTCIGCRGKAPKGELIRLVGGADGVKLDETGSAPGRGAYLHRARECITTAIRKGAVARALRTGLAQGEAGRLRALLEEEPRGQ